MEGGWSFVDETDEAEDTDVVRESPESCFFRTYVVDELFATFKAAYSCKRRFLSGRCWSGIAVIDRLYCLGLSCVGGVPFAFSVAMVLCAAACVGGLDSVFGSGLFFGVLFVE